MKKENKYKLKEMKGSGRFWFSRAFLDEKHGRERDVVLLMEKAGWEWPDLISALPWNLTIQDRATQQTWKLVMMKFNGEDKLMFERQTQTVSGVKTENFDLAYLPTWITDELQRVDEQTAEKKFDAGINFLHNLSKKIEREKKQLKFGSTAKIEELSIGGLYHIWSQTKGDHRGSFREVARMPELEILTGYDFVGKQVNHSVSCYGTLRGVHVEPWAKLVTVISGLAVCVLLDCRPKSKTFGKKEVVYLGYGKTPDGTEVTGGALFIEPGIGNSVLVLSDRLDYNYVVDDLWRPETALYAVNPFDATLGIKWDRYVPEEKIVRSERDMKSPSFAEFAKQRKGK